MYPIDSHIIPLPSPLVTVKPSLDGVVPQEIVIPRNELFRIRDIFWKHTYSLPEFWSPRESLRVVDVGANVGCFSIYAQRWAKQVSVYSFEPNPQIWPLLEQNTAHLPNIHCYPSGLSDYDGESALYLHPRNTGQASLRDRNQTRQAIQVTIRHAGAMLTELDLPYIDVLKVDTEGAEVSIFTALADWLPHTDIVMYEYQTREDRRSRRQSFQKR